MVATDTLLIINSLSMLPIDMNASISAYAGHQMTQVENRQQESVECSLSVFRESCCREAESDFLISSVATNCLPLTPERSVYA